MRNFFQTVFIVVMTFIAIDVLMAAPSINISQPSIVIRAIPGTVYTGSITLSNTATVPYVFTPNFEDCRVELGVPQCQKIQQPLPSVDLSAWITFPQQQHINISPKTKYTVPYSIRVPSDVEPGKHYGTLYYDVPNTDRSHPDKTIFVVEITGAINPGLALGPVTMTGGGDTLATTFIFPVKNTGNVRLVPMGSVSLVSSGVSLGEFSLNIEKNTVSPGKETPIRLQWEGAGLITSPSGERAIWEREWSEDKIFPLDMRVNLNYIHPVTERVLGYSIDLKKEIPYRVIHRELNTSLIGWLGGICGLVLIFILLKSIPKPKPKKYVKSVPTRNIDEIRVLEAAQAELESVKKSSPRTRKKITPSKSTGDVALPEKKTPSRKRIVKKEK